MAKRYRIITRRATTREWLDARRLPSDARVKPGFFIQRRGLLRWTTMTIGDGAGMAGYYYSQANAENDLGNHIIRELEKACEPRGTVAEYKVDFTLEELQTWHERKENVKSLRR